MSSLRLGRPLSSGICCWQSIFELQSRQKFPSSSITFTRAASIHRRNISLMTLEGRDVMPNKKTKFISRGQRLGLETKPPIAVHPPPGPAAPKRVISALTDTHIKTLDASGTKSKLISRTNKDAIKVGDILQVRFTPQSQMEPFSGVLINLRRRGIDTGLLLRNQLTRVGVEMWVKLYSPNVAGIDVVQRAVKRARRARLTYMRKPKHDIGSVQNIVAQYTRQRELLRSGGVKKDAGAAAASGPRRFTAKKK